MRGIKGGLLFLFSLAIIVTSLPSKISATVVYQRDSLYSHIRVEDSGGIRTLWFNNCPQSTMYVNDPSSGALEYTEFFHSALAIKPSLRRVLVLGLGGGSTQKAFLNRYPDVSVTTVEIDPVVVEVAKKFFYVPESPRHKIVIEDARRYLSRSGGGFDAILIDAYLADYYGAYVPFHLATKEFFQLVSKNLSDGGVVAYNVTAQINGWNSSSLSAIYKTMSSVFGQMYLFPARRLMNVVVVGAKDGRIPSMERLRANAREVDRYYGRLPVSISSVIAYAQSSTLDLSVAPLLTDNYAPVELLPLFR